MASVLIWTAQLLLLALLRLLLQNMHLHALGAAAPDRLGDVVVIGTRLCRHDELAIEPLMEPLSLIMAQVLVDSGLQNQARIVAGVTNSQQLRRSSGASALPLVAGRRHCRSVNRIRRLPVVVARISFRTRTSSCV